MKKTVSGLILMALALGCSEARAQTTSEVVPCSRTSRAKRSAITRRSSGLFPGQRNWMCSCGGNAGIDATSFEVSFLLDALA